MERINISPDEGDQWTISLEMLLEIEAEGPRDRGRGMNGGSRKTSPAPAIALR
jgi:hypothetical protein